MGSLSPPTVILYSLAAPSSVTWGAKVSRSEVLEVRPFHLVSSRDVQQVEARTVAAHRCNQPRGEVLGIKEAVANLSVAI